MNKDDLNLYTRNFLEGKLSREKEKELLDWVKLSKENRALFLEEQELLKNHILSQNNASITPKWKSIEQRLIPGIKRKTSKTLFIKISSLAATFILGALLCYVIIDDVKISTVQLTQALRVNVPFGAKANIELPDGSSVWLNSGSTLSYPAKFEKTRLVTLIGEAFFSVKKSGSPFIVSTNYGEVKVMGTSFNVKAFQDEDMETTLVSGTVLVKEKDSKNETPLRPGQQALVLNGKLSVSNVETDIFTSWKEGKLIFREEYLPRAIKKLERWYNVHIELDHDNRLQDIWFSGTLEMESLSEVLVLLKATSPIAYEFDEKIRTIKIKFNQN